ncbi:P-loop containing nucleoside triphosphate hydrolase protein [Mycena filopes]|nr:P-loop containing nucleoside triphosphate hydrolase protein [Mycena filopes]
MAKRSLSAPNAANLTRSRLVLDGEDIVCCMATGGGKSALFAVPIVVLREIARNPGLYPKLPTRPLPVLPGPVGVVITPTKGLAANIVVELQKLGVPALAYCHETVTEARKSGRNLAHEIRDCKTWSVICVDPEHLREKAWRLITASDVFRANIVYGCVDGAHLIRDWGAEFRPQFKQIGAFFRGRLPSSASIMAVSATIQPGPALNSICSSLGMSRNEFYLLRLSNERPNTQFIMEPLENGVGGKVFPQLLGILNSGRKAAIHCRTIDDVFRVFLYLWKFLPPGPHRLRRLKMYHSLRSAEDNQEIIRLLDEDPACQVVIATVAFATGLNVKSLLDSISLGFPDTVDQMWQEKGRVGRDPATAARGIVLFQPSTLAAAEKQLAGEPVERHFPAVKLIRDFEASSDPRPAPTARSKAKKPAKPLEPAKVQLLTEKYCLNAAVNCIYQNPPLDTTVLDCIAVKRQYPCSLCATRHGLVLKFSAPPLPPGTYLPPFTAPLPNLPGTVIDKKFKLTAKERDQAKSVFVKFGETVRLAERKNPAHQNRPKAAFFPTSIMRPSLDALLTIKSFDNLEPLMASWVFARGNRVRLYAIVDEIRTTIESQRKEVQKEKKAKRDGKWRKAKKMAVWEDESDEDGDGSEKRSEEEEEVDPHPRSSPIPPPPKGSRTILDEVTNDARPARVAPKKGPPKKLQTAAEVAQSYSAPYRTTSRRHALPP